MANKRVYYTVVAREGSLSGSVVGLIDSFTGGNIPLDTRNSDYQQYLLLSASDRAIAVDGPGSVPGDVVNSPECFVVSQSFFVR